ncbi:hypothetical protein ACFY1D_24330 [Streptomyces bluensis]|uniref:Transposase n=1 Tax=Streptomyces bluensis TaxID=33897 RepID=A0ABW6UPN7_9ACTN
MLTVVNEDGTTPSGGSLLDQVVRERTRRMLAAALEAEVNACIAELPDERDDKGHRQVVARAGARFERGHLVERDEVNAA